MKLIISEKNDTFLLQYKWTQKNELVTELIELCLMPFSNTFSFYNGLKVSDKTDTLNIIYSGTCHQIDTIKHWYKMKDFPHSKQLLQFYYIIKESHSSLGIGLFQPVKTIHISVPDEGYSRNNTHISSWWRLFQKRVVSTKLDLYIFIFIW